MVVIRSAWGKYLYREQYHKFQEMIDEIAILMNPLKVIQWQANKDVYMKQLRDAGINTPETYVLSLEDVQKDESSGVVEYIQEQAWL
jgi:glutathione synthase/RimK-type ligase-like ATP-grasp enzyme